MQESSEERAVNGFSCPVIGVFLVLKKMWQSILTKKAAKASLS